MKKLLIIVGFFILSLSALAAKMSCFDEAEKITRALYNIEYGDDSQISILGVKPINCPGNKYRVEIFDNDLRPVLTYKVSFSNDCRLKSIKK